MARGGWSGERGSPREGLPALVRTSLFSLSEMGRHCRILTSNDLICFQCITLAVAKKRLPRSESRRGLFQQCQQDMIVAWVKMAGGL